MSFVEAKRVPQLLELLVRAMMTHDAGKVGPKVARRKDANNPVLQGSTAKVRKAA